MPEKLPEKVLTKERERGKRYAMKYEHKDLRVAEEPPHLSRAAGEVAALASIYGLRQADLARMVGCSERSLRLWAAGREPRAAALNQLRELRRLLDDLARIFTGPRAVGACLLEPNAAFAGSTPLQVAERGEWGRLWRMAYEVGTGQPG